MATPIRYCTVEDIIGSRDVAGEFTRNELIEYCSDDGDNLDPAEQEAKIARTLSGYIDRASAYVLSRLVKNSSPSAIVWRNLGEVPLEIQHLTRRKVKELLGTRRLFQQDSVLETYRVIGREVAAELEQIRIGAAGILQYGKTEEIAQNTKYHGAKVFYEKDRDTNGFYSGTNRDNLQGI